MKKTVDKVKIAPEISSKLLKAVDAKAAQFDISRAKFITLALEKAVKLSKAELLL